jgi:TolB-like protein/Flp pilus assembly protein TadD
VLYEMLTGRTPFVGPTAQAIIAQCFTSAPPPLRTAGNGVPEWAEQAILKALAKEPGGRFATAAAFAQALKAPGAATTPPGATTATPAPQTATVAKSIAVLPFVNMSADPENEYFTDGIAEEIINALTKVQALRVASRTSSFAFKGKNQDIRKVGEQLNVATVLEGSVRKAGTKLRVTAQLVSVTDGYHLWSERYDRELQDVFAIQDEIAGNIVRALRVVLSDAEKRAIEKAPTDNVQAYDYYLRGRQFFHQFRRTGIQFARRMFERALEIDPGYVLAYAGAADCCSFLYMYWDASKANLETADGYSRKALELDPDLAEAHASRGLAESLSKRYEAAEREFATAIRLNPKLYEAHYFYGRTSFQQAKFAEAVLHFEEASRVRPEDYQAAMLISMPYSGLGRQAEAQAALRHGLQVIEKHLELNPDDVRALYLGGIALAQVGERDRALEWAARALALDSEDSGVLYNVACVKALAGLKEEGFACLEKAIQNGFGHREWLENDSDLESLREDPRFQSLLNRL